MQNVSAHDAKARFGQRLDTARYEPVVIERHGRAVAVVVSKEEPMNAKTIAATSFLLLLAAVGVRAEGGASAQAMMQKMEMMEKMELMERMDLDEQLDAAKACAAKDQFDCAKAGLAKAATLSQDPTAQRDLAAARGYVQQQVDRHNETVRLAEEQAARQGQERQRLAQEAARQEQERQRLAQEQARRAEMQKQLATAAACAEKYQWECTVDAMKQARALSQSSADQDQYNKVYEYAMQQNEKAKRLAEQEKQQQYSSGGYSPSASSSPSYRSPPMTSSSPRADPVLQGAYQAKQWQMESQRRQDSMWNDTLRSYKYNR